MTVGQPDLFFMVCAVDVDVAIVRVGVALLQTVEPQNSRHNQILLLEEFRKAACDVEFIERPISDDPHDQLLLQIQGAIAEYERAVLAERFRRGKLQKARAGQWVGGRAPYGYRYVPKRDGVPGHLAKTAFERAAEKLPIKTKVVARLGETLAAEEKK